MIKYYYAIWAMYDQLLIFMGVYGPNETCHLMAREKRAPEPSDHKLFSITAFLCHASAALRALLLEVPFARAAQHLEDVPLLPAPRHSARLDCYLWAFPVAK